MIVPVKAVTAIAAGNPRALSLPILLEPAVPALLPTERPALPEIPAGDPFSAHKILNHFDRLQGIVRGEMVFPITVEIDPTNVCNHRCKWCVSIEAHTGEVLTLGRFTALLDELHRSDVRSVVLKGGGEPTAHPQFIEMLDALHQRRISTGLITNGSMPRKGSTWRIRQTCQWVRVSLDAASAQTHHLIHGTKDFDRILANVDDLVNGDDAGAEEQPSDLVVGLNFVAEPRNFAEMADFARLGKSLGVRYVTIRCVFDPLDPLPDETRRAMRAMALEAKREQTQEFRVFLGNFTDRYLDADRHAPFPHARCMGPNLVGIVGGDGEVYACCFLRGNRAFSFGSINEQGFTEIWQSERRRQVMDAVYRGECGRVCAGGMTANRYTVYNEILNYLAAEEKQHADFA